MYGKTFAGKSAFVISGVFALVGLLIVGGITGAAFAGREHRPSHFTAHVVEELALDDTQQESLRTMLAATGEKRKQLRTQSAATIRAVVMQDAMHKKDAIKLLQLRQQNRDEMHDFIAEKIAVFHSELDSAQREKLAAIAPRLLSRMMRDGKNRKHGRHYGHDNRRGMSHRNHDRHHDDDDDDDDERHHDDN